MRQEIQALIKITFDAEAENKTIADYRKAVLEMIAKALPSADNDLLQYIDCKVICFHEEAEIYSGVHEVINLMDVTKWADIHADVLSAGFVLKIQNVRGAMQYKDVQTESDTENVYSIFEVHDHSKQNPDFYTQHETDQINRINEICQDADCAYFRIIYG